MYLNKLFVVLTICCAIQSAYAAPILKVAGQWKRKITMKTQKLFIIALLINPTAIYAAINDTGITTCSNATQNGLPCPVAGFPGQDAEYGTNAFDFTKLDADGSTTLQEAIFANS